MDPGHTISMLLGWAVILPLCSFFVILVFGPRMGKSGEHASSLATAAIALAAILSFASLLIWLANHRPGHEAHGEDHASLVSPDARMVVRGQEPHGESKSSAKVHGQGHAEPHLKDGQDETESHAQAVVTKHYAGDFNEPTGLFTVEKAGLKLGDIVTRLNGQPIESANQFRDTVATTASGMAVELEVFRDGHTRRLKVKPGLLGDATGAADVPAGSAVATQLGVTVRTLTHELGNEDEQHGVVVTQVEPAGIVAGAWVLGEFGALRLSISYYIDSLTVCMFCMVTFIATLIHIYATGYMHEELHEVTDYEVKLASGKHLHRPGRYPRFFQYLSLFCFSMLGLVIAGNIAMVFVFWELVGVCSYFLIGFYVERKSASNAANKAFIVNRVGDFGMILGLLALWTGLGTFSFGDYDYVGTDGQSHTQVGIFTQVREVQTLVHGDGHTENRRMAAPDGMVRWSARREIAGLARDHLSYKPDEAIAATDSEASFRTADWRRNGYGYGLLILAGVGIFCGCVGKSAQFPLHVWLPDAMEGPTPVSALVHSATMVAAGVYLVGRFYPVFTPEVLLVIAVAGVITLFMAATIAITATDIKRVLAYSTVSQLGYMMMALGVGGWLAGMMHLITHAFFKSLLFMGSGSVIHAVHTNEMTEMGGLRKKMPVTAYTMLVGCLAIAGAGIPFIMSLLATSTNHEALKGVGFSGFYSKDAILEQAYSFMRTNDSAFAGVFFLAAAGGAAITAFYMFRMWYMTFAGKPRDEKRYDHAHESPPTMYVPLIILAVMAVGVAWSPLQGVVAGACATLAFFVWRRVRGNKQQEHASHAAHDGHTDEHGDDGHHSHASLPAWLGDLPWGLSALALVVAAIWAVGGLGDITLAGLLGQANPVDDHVATKGVWLESWTWPAVHAAHDPSVVIPVSLIAIGTALTGFLLATAMYGVGYLNPAEVRAQFQWIYRFLINKWWFDELYDRIFIRPTHVVSGWVSGTDRNCIDWLIDGLATVTRRFSTFWAWLADGKIVDGFVDGLAATTHSLGLSLRAVQTGRIRQYVMFIVIGAVAIFILISFFWNPTLAG